MNNAIKFKCGLWAILILTLIFCAGGCDNPANSDGNSAGQPAANEFTSSGTLQAWLAGKAANTEANPYQVLYTGNETAPVIYDTLEAAGRYVDLDLSKSTVSGFSPGGEEGREFIVYLTLPDALKVTPEEESLSIFDGCFNLKKVSARELTRIGNNTFRNCVELIEVDFPKVVAIGANAFFGCAALETVNLPEALSIDSAAFQNCNALETINLPGTNIIGNSAFRGCASLNSVQAPEASYIGFYSFQECVRLETLSLPKAVFVRGNAFQGCTGLETIAIPSVSEFGNSVFQGCTSLTTISLGNTPPVIGSATSRIFTQAAAGPRTITFQVPNVNVYITAGTPWSDKMGDYSIWTDGYWDNNVNTRANLTVALAVFE